VGQVGILALIDYTGEVSIAINVRVNISWSL